jgi:hypothetical protein
MRSLFFYSALLILQSWAVAGEIKIEPSMSSSITALRFGTVERFDVSPKYYPFKKMRNVYTDPELLIAGNFYRIYGDRINNIGDTVVCALLNQSFAGSHDAGYTDSRMKPIQYPAVVFYAATYYNGIQPAKFGDHSFTLSWELFDKIACDE